VGLPTLNSGGWSKEPCRESSQFQHNDCFSAWRNGVGKWRSWSGMVHLVCFRG